MKLTFIRAVHEVTGSCTLLQVSSKNYLIDCGMEQGRDMFENITLPVSAAEIDAVFLTHAHIDHSGMLPKLYKDGFKGTIYSTTATQDLCGIMLKDTAHIQESEAEWKNRKALRSGGQTIEPIYGMNDALGAIKLFKGCKYGERYRVCDSVTICFTDVGHLLGSACIEVWLSENGVNKKIVFSGDVGNINHPIIKDPLTVDGADYVMIESTYGNRLHGEEHDAFTALAGFLQKAFDRGGSVVIPSFAVGRTQELLYILRDIKQRGLVKGHDRFPVYVDSPLAIEATHIFMKCDISYFDKEMHELLEQGINPIWNDDIVLSVTSDDSKAINFDRRPKVIISASGMCEAGRIRHHLKHNLWRAENIILFVGYQSSGSMGRALLEGAQSVKLFGEEVAVTAEICSLQGTSGHADKNGLINWLTAMKNKPQTVFVNHGDNQSCEDFKNCLINDYGYNAIAPFSGTQYDLAAGEISVQTEGKRIEKAQPQQFENTRAQIIFTALADAANELLLLAKSYKGHSNKEISQFTNQIRALISKWK